MSDSPLPFRYIAVEGPIGAGKTSLVKRLAERFRGTRVLEDVDNPFLPEFYKDKKGSAFQCQLFFLLSRYDQQRKIAQRDLFSDLVVADYSFQKDKIYAYLTLDDSELLIYNKLFDVLAEQVPVPDLVIYLQGNIDTLIKRLRKRGKDYEKSVTTAYVQEVSEAYAHYFYHYSGTPLLVVNTSEIDFVHDDAHFEDLVDQIRQVTKGTKYYVPLGS